MPRYVCFECKTKLSSEERIAYKSHGYCKECFEKKKARDDFYDELCRYFGFKKPGPKLHSQHKRLIEKGFNDETILNVLHYIKDVEHWGKVDGLGVVNEERAWIANEYYRKKEERMKKFVQDMMNINVKESAIVRNVEQVSEEPQLLNPLDYLKESDEY